MQPHQILVVIDPTSGDSQPSLERATWVAQRSNSSIELLLCEYNSALDGGYFFDGPAQKKARESLLSNRVKWLEKLAQPLRDAGVTVTTEARWGKPLHTMILQRIEEIKPDLVLREAHSHSLLQRLFFNNTSWQLIRYCPVPLWLVRDVEWRGERVCAAVDPVHSSDKTATLDHRLVKATRWISDNLQMQADYLHSYAPLPRTMIFDSELVAAYEQYVERSAKQHQEAFANLMADYPIAKEKQHLLEGFPEEVIPAFVEEHQTDLLVMGAISRGNLENALIGNTAERILEAVQTDLLVIKPTDTKE
ncbi:universal stress protein [Denitrificimonas sp. JX-1]|uniref:Universal stress protein n=1 Tax=Denitrificimonas halotolerans TaxID=3098930 RepID=A0ABU5GPR9_9GAMM|nr:universal stress protein [Denitrificimonas sp. JX-1]MDY7218994.1 universal stress protein [Denitrificimonas sp. JX-1]